MIARPTATRTVLLALLGGFAACAPAMTPGAPAPEGVRLPPIPRSDGALDIEVVYPPEGARIAAPDSTFVFGNVGRGGASLTINGASVPVEANGAWLAFLPVPADGQYRLVATADGASEELVRTVQVPAAAATPSTALRIVPGSISPSGTITGFAGESFEVRFRGTPGGFARLILPDSTVVPLVETRAVDRRSGFMLQSSSSASSLSEYVGSFSLDRTLANPAPDVVPPTLAADGGDLPPSPAAAGARVELTVGGQTVREALPAAIAILDPMRPRVAVAATDRPDSTVIGRRLPGSDQAWDFFWPNGTLLTVDGEASGMYRVRLTPELSAWVSPSDVELLPVGTPAPSGWVGPSIEVEPADGWAEVRFSMSDRLPFRIDSSEFGLGVEFYGATGRPAYVGYGEQDDFVHRVDWEQRTDELFRFDLHLTRPLWGYRYFWDGSTLVLHVRRPPAIDPNRPLAGLRIAIDAGHYGYEGDSGAVGPTGLTEVESTLMVTRALAPLLREAGAEVIEIRPEAAVVPLIDRPVRAADIDADLFISVHFNAFPDGVNPFENHGTTMFYFWPQSLPFARALQREIVGEFGLPDRGVRYQNLAITRSQWMPAVLTETLFLMIPQNEAALRQPGTVERIAEAHRRAMESFVRERATLRLGPEAF